MSLTLDSVALTLPGQADPSVSNHVPLPSWEMAWARLQPLHRHIMMTEKLAEGLSVAMSNSAADTVEVKLDGAVICEMTSPFPSDPNAPDGAAKAKAALQPVLDRRWLRAERAGEIVAQQTDILSFLGLSYPMSRYSHPMTMAVLDAVLAAIGKVVVQAKHLLNAPRPIQLSSAVSPIIATPAHAACPSGHASEAYAMAFAMEALMFGCASTELRLIAARIEENRIFSGVHYEHDGWMGRKLAAAVAPIFAQRLGLTSTAPTVAEVDQYWSASGETGVWSAYAAHQADPSQTVEWLSGAPEKTGGLNPPAPTGRDDVLAIAMQKVAQEIGA